LIILTTPNQKREVEPMADEVVTPETEDQDDDLDGCDVAIIEDATLDEELPAAEGGVG